jgi:hypothetical protein
MIYEMRRYESVPGKLEALQRLMVEAAMPVFKKLDMQVIGAWVPVIGDDEYTVIYMLAYNSMDERNAKWDAFFEDPDWLQNRARIAEEEGGAFVARSVATFLNPTSYSPLQ